MNPLLAAVAALAVVVPGHGMRGVELGWTRAQVRAELGRPEEVIVRPSEITGRDLSYRYGLTEVAFAARGDAVTSIATTSRRERTAGGVGVGSTAGAVLTRVPRSRCATEYGVRHCWVGAFRPGATVTDFRLDARGRVRQIVIGIVID